MPYNAAPIEMLVIRLFARELVAPLPRMLHAVQAFDDLLLLKSGGLVTYHGSLGKRSCKLIEYFQVRAPPAKAPMTPTSA